MNKKIFTYFPFFLILVIGLFFSLYAANTKQEIRQKAAAATAITLKSSNISPKIGDEITISVELNAGANEVIGSDLALSFDPVKLQALNITPGDYFLQTVQLRKKIDNSNGVLTFSGYAPLAPNAHGIKKIGIIANIKFKTKTTGETIISLTPETIVAGYKERKNVLFTTIPAKIAILSLTPTPSVTPKPTNTPTPTLKPTSTPISTTNTPTRATTTRPNNTMTPIKTPTISLSTPTLVPTATVGTFPTLISSPIQITTTNLPFPTAAPTITKSVTQSPNIMGWIIAGIIISALGLGAAIIFFYH